MAGFKDEKQLWKWMKPRLQGRWERLEAIFPVGMPDAFGTFDDMLHFVELKVGRPTLTTLRPEQREFIRWQDNGPKETITPCFVAFGDPHLKDVTFLRWGAPVRPLFWKG